MTAVPDEGDPGTRMEVSGNPDNAVLINRAGTVNLVAEHRREIPDELPTFPVVFDRSAELARLSTILDGDSPLILVHGDAGIGKSALTYKWTRSLRDRFPDGFLYCDLLEHDYDGRVNLEEVLGSLLSSLEIPDERIPAGVPNRARLWRSATAARRLLVVLDNLNEPGMLKHLQQGLDKGSVLVVVSRINAPAFLAEGAVRLTVLPLDPAHSVKLLQRLAGADRVATESTSVRRLAAACDGLPHALTAVGRCLAAVPELTVDRLATMVADRPTEAIPSAAYRLIVDSLDTPARALRRRLLAHPGKHFGAELAVALADGVPGSPTVDDLVAAGLVEPDGEHRWRLTDRGGTDEPDDGAVATVVDWYRRVARLADRSYMGADRLRVVDVEVTAPDPLPSLTNGEALEWLDTELANLMAVQRLAADRGWYEAVVSLEESLWVLYLHRRHPGFREYTSALAVEAAHRWQNPVAESRMRAQRARFLMDLGRPEAALTELDEAGRLAAVGSRPDLVASVAEMSGRALVDLGRFVDAHRRFDAASAHYERTGYEYGLAVVHQLTARALMKEERFAEAEVSFGAARDGFIGSGSGRGEGSVLLELAELYVLAEDPRAERALRAANRRLTEFRQDLRLIRSHTLLGDLMERKRNLAEARTHWREALRIHRRQNCAETPEAAELAARLAE